MTLMMPGWRRYDGIVRSDPQRLLLVVNCKILTFSAAFIINHAICIGEWYCVIAEIALLVGLLL